MKFRLPLIGGVPESLAGFLKSPGSQEDSLKRLVSWMAAATLCVFGYGILLTMIAQAASGTPIDPILRDCFIAVVGFVSTLAMVAYRKTDTGGKTDDPPKA